MKKILPLLLTLTLCLSLCACNKSAGGNEPAKPSVTELYNQFVTLVSDGIYKEALRYIENHPELENHSDVAKYKTYCLAMNTYNAGALGDALAQLKEVEDILIAKDTIATIEEKIAFLNGKYSEDAEDNAVMQLVIQDGAVAMQFFVDEAVAQEFNPSEEDFTTSIVSGKFENGVEYLAVGTYSEDKVTVKYIISTFTDSADITLLAPKDADNSFNGLYVKQLEKQQEEPTDTPAES